MVEAGTNETLRTGQGRLWALYTDRAEDCEVAVDDRPSAVWASYVDPGQYRPLVDWLNERGGWAYMREFDWDSPAGELYESARAASVIRHVASKEIGDHVLLAVQYRTRTDGCGAVEAPGPDGLRVRRFRLPWSRPPLHLRRPPAFFW